MVSQVDWAPKARSLEGLSLRGDLKSRSPKSRHSQVEASRVKGLPSREISSRDFSMALETKSLKPRRSQGKSLSVKCCQGTMQLMDSSRDLVDLDLRTPREPSTREPSTRAPRLGRHRLERPRLGRPQVESPSVGKLSTAHPLELRDLDLRPPRRGNCQLNGRWIGGTP